MASEATRTDSAAKTGTEHFGASEVVEVEVEADILKDQEVIMK